MALGLKAGNKVTKNLKSSRDIGEIVSKVKDQFQIEIIERRAIL